MEAKDLDHTWMDRNLRVLLKRVSLCDSHPGGGDAEETLHLSTLPSHTCYSHLQLLLRSAARPQTSAGCCVSGGTVCRPQAIQSNSNACT